jgi:chloramphenicol 3-O-phosphotransferase
MFVLLSVDEEEWVRRERTRGDRPQIRWPRGVTTRDVLAAAGDSSSYDLVIDTARLRPQEIADLIRDAAEARWGPD